jgi:F0F1-type ATP synthase delta subunit
MQENSTYIDSYVNVLSEIVLKSPKKTYRQILSLTKIIEKNSAVNFFFENKWFSVNEKKKRLTEIFSKYFDKELIAFLKVIIDDGK